MASVKLDRELHDKRPLRLECKGGPMPWVRIDARTPPPELPIKDETGNGSIVGVYRLSGAAYVWEPRP
jgi:hypothetical protein